VQEVLAARMPWCEVRVGEVHASMPTWALEAAL
jgi:hypothetical protein